MELLDPSCKTRKCVNDKGLPHCGYCDEFPCAIFPAEPSENELRQKIEVEHLWSWEEEKLIHRDVPNVSIQRVRPHVSK